MVHSAMADEQMTAVFDEAAQFDPTLQLTASGQGRLAARYVDPENYTRQTLFNAMLTAEPCVLRGYNVPLQSRFGTLPSGHVAPAIMDWFADKADDQTFRVYTGPTGVKRQLTLAEIASKWHRNSTRFGVTDLHIRNSALEEIIAPDKISGFNLLRRSTPVAQTLEMFSYVISSYGHVTDSHSDAPDSTNYCITGKKLWLAWDTYEGAKAGLQDVERVAVSKRAKFDMDAWLSLPSARWLLVEPGQTLFLPASMTHKVVTLGRYIGVGGFYISLPNCLRLMAHWILHIPLWSKRDAAGEFDFLLSDIAETVTKTILEAPSKPQSERELLGFDYLKISAQHFIETCSAKQMRQLWVDPRFRCIADTIDVRWPLPTSLAAA